MASTACRVLIVRLDHMGDVVLTVPPVAASIVASHPGIAVDVLTTGVGSALLAGDPSLSRILTFSPPWSVPPDSGGGWSRREWIRNCLRLPAAHGWRGPGGYDWILYLSFSPWERYLTRGWGRNRGGFVGPYRSSAFRFSNRLLTLGVPFEEGRHVTENALNLASAALPLSVRIGECHLSIDGELRDAGRDRLNSLGAEGDRWLVVHAGSARSMKSWPIESFVEAAQRLRSGSALEPVFIGLPGEVSHILEAHRSMGLPAPRSLETPGIRDLMGVAAHATLFLGNDGGPMHVAAALGVPTLGVFGPTDEAVFGPRGRRSRTVRQPGICGPMQYPWRVATCCRRTDRECLRGIKVETVLTEAEALLREGVRTGAEL